MKDRFKNFVTFNKSERYGLMVLFAIILLLIAARIYVTNRNSNLDIDNEKLAKALNTPQNPTQAPPSPLNSTTEPHPLDTGFSPSPHPYSTQTPPTLFPFDPNTVDSLSLRRLGLREKTTAIFLHWRAKGKIFRKKEDLKGLYTLSTAEYERLAPYIVIKEEKRPHPTYPHPNLNTADSLTLLKVNGIGPRLAHRIIQYRNEHGPLTSYDELFNIYNFPDSTFQRIQEQFRIK
jgi:hypothetical protein